MQVSTGCCITQGGVTAGDGDGEDCDADTGNWFVVSSTLPSLHWGHLQRDQWHRCGTDVTGNPNTNAGWRFLSPPQNQATNDILQ